MVVVAGGARLLRGNGDGDWGGAVVVLIVVWLWFKLWWRGEFNGLAVILLNVLLEATIIAANADDDDDDDAEGTEVTVTLPTNVTEVFDMAPILGDGGNDPSAIGADTDDDNDDATEADGGRVRGRAAAWPCDWWLVVDNCDVDDGNCNASPAIEMTDDDVFNVKWGASLAWPLPLPMLVGTVRVAGINNVAPLVTCVATYKWLLEDDDARFTPWIPATAVTGWEAAALEMPATWRDVPIGDGGSTLKLWLLPPLIGTFNSCDDDEDANDDEEDISLAIGDATAAAAAGNNEKPDDDSADGHITIAGNNGDAGGPGNWSSVPVPVPVAITVPGHCTTPTDIVGVDIDDGVVDAWSFGSFIPSTSLPMPLLSLLGGDDIDAMIPLVLLLLVLVVSICAAACCKIAFFCSINSE
jgi:hypothetical protein